MSSGAPEVTPNIREVWGLVRARTKELRQKFEGYIGPPQGAYISTSPSPPPN